MNAYLASVLENVRTKHGNEPEFVQTVEEVLSSLEPVIEKHPEYEKVDLLNRMVEPERMFTFRVVWCDDNGQWHTNRGWRCQFNGAKKYFIARKGPKAYMPDPIHVEDQSITTAGTQKLYLGRDDADLICGKRIVLMDDVISTGGSLRAMEDLVALAGGTVVARIAVLAEGDAAKREDIRFLAPLPLFNADGSVK